MQKIIHYLGILLLVVPFHSCVSHKELINFNEGAAFAVAPEDIIGIPEIRIQPDDILSITVHTLNSLTPEDVTPFGGQSQAASSPQMASGYLVDKDGYIDFPMIGSIKMSGLATPEAKDTLTQRLKEYLQNPVVNVRFLNFKFTVFGEVQAPGTYSLANEKITILEAIGTARDLTIYANRANVLIIREQNGKREYGHIDLHSRQLFLSPYFYLRPNDVIYVEPLKEKVNTVTDRVSKVLPWIGLGTTFLNLIVILARN